jgi:hypothetical protein
MPFVAVILRIRCSIPVFPGMTNHLWIVSDLDNLQSARTLRIGSDALTLERDEVQMRNSSFL